MMSRAAHARPVRASGGFLLLEALVTVAIIMLVVAALGALFATTMAGVRKSGDRTALIQAVRVALDDLPVPSRLVAGSYAGKVNGMSWAATVDARADLPRPLKDPTFVPMTVLMTVTSSTGTQMKVEAVRSRRVGQQ